MRYSTRTFLLLFVPFALVLTGSFSLIQYLVQGAVRDSLRTSLRQTQASIAMVRSKGELHNTRFLRILSENATLKAGMELLRAEPHGSAARLTLEDQLREMCETLELDLLVATDPEGHPHAGVFQHAGKTVPADLKSLGTVKSGLLRLGDRIFQVAATPVNLGEEHIGLLAVGEAFDFSEFTTPAVLVHNGRLLRSSVPGVPHADIEQALRSCPGQSECELHLAGEVFLSAPVQSLFLDGGYELRSLQSMDQAGTATQAILRRVFLTAGVGALVAALALSLMSSRSIVRPLALVVARLRTAAATGVLPEFPNVPLSRIATVHEIRELMLSFNRAAHAHRDAREKLLHAYVEFVGSLANALDARDAYTAGHSRRVSEYACALAEAVGMAEQERGQLRVGALLHDIGKIGIADGVLQKPGRLTPEEFSIIQQHPRIGRKILEGVNGFQAYLPVVELHHENWDGSGYPYGLRGAAVPLDARIVHVADAYDAMTSDRPYRRGMSHEQAVELIAGGAGTQFDPDLAKAFVALPTLAAIRSQPGQSSDSLHNLAVAVEPKEPVALREPSPQGSA
ncbi:MAG: HD-GYP domain-containing protein [Bryobacterales bacterium]|nr:HD-GYP domain-containing protein [Bryobacterales bacterium]